MFNRKRVLVLAAVAAVTTAAVVAQGPGSGPGPGGMRFGHGERMKEFIATYLDLTETQKEKAKVIFEKAKAEAEPVRAKLKAGHEAVQNAVKANAAPVELERLAKAQGELMGQMAAVHVKAMAEFYQILTPEQKEKAEKLHERAKDMLMQRFGH